MEKITSDLVAVLRFGVKSDQWGEKIEKKERVEKSTLVKFLCLGLVEWLPAGLIGKKEVKESDCSKREREREGRSKDGSFEGKADEVVQRESR